MISLAIIGLVQALFLPGFIVACLATRLPLADRLLLATPLSLLVNYGLVFVLVGLGAYSQVAMIAIFIVEVGLLLRLRPKPFEGSLVRPTRGHADDIEAALITLVKLVTLALLLEAWTSRMGAVFEHSDAIISWNRWAMEWYSQIIPSSQGYPQTGPILYSIIYKFAGTTNLQSFSKVVAVWFPFFGVLCIWRIATWAKGMELACALSGAMFVYLLFALSKGSSAWFLYSGYMDPIMASLLAFVMYACALVSDRRYNGFDATVGNHNILVILLCVGVTAIVKQSGVPVALLFALLLLLLNWRAAATSPGRLVIVVTAFLVLVFHYYAAALILQLFGGNGLLNTDFLISTPFRERPRAAFGMLLAACGSMALVFAAAGVLTAIGRVLLIFFIAPMFLFWAFFVSYDLRTAFTLVPFLAMEFGLGLALWLGISRRPDPWQALIVTVLKWTVFSAVVYWLLPGQPDTYLDIHLNDHAFHLFGYLAILYLAASVVMVIKLPHSGILARGWLLHAGLAVSAAVLCVLPLLVTAEQLANSNNARRMATGEPVLNAKLDEIFTRHPPRQILSMWAAIYNIPSIQDHFTHVGNCATEMFMQGEFGYYLYWNACPAAVLASVRESLTKMNIPYLEETLAPEFILIRKMDLDTPSQGGTK